MEHKFAGRILTILIVLAIGLLGIFFDFQTRSFKNHNLKRGIDILGGTKLVYEIKTPPGPVADDLSDRVASALKRRVDPQGVRNLVWRPLGPTRLEIQMPMTSGTGSAAARKAFSDAEAQLERTNIRIAEVEAALEIQDPAQRQQALQELAMGSEKRMALFNQLAAAEAELADARKANDPLRIVDADDAVRDIKDQIQQTNLPPRAFERVLELQNAIVEKAEKGGNQQIAAQRRQELQAKVAEHLDAADFPARRQAIENFVEHYLAYAKVKGSLDDAESLKRLLRGSGVLEFHILVEDPQLFSQMNERLQAEGPAVKPGDTMRWYEVDRPEQFKRPVAHYADKAWALAYITPDKSMVHKEGQRDWGLAGAHRDTDQRSGQQIVSFQFDSYGADLFGELTGTNLQQPLAIMLDDKIISAPNIQSRITSSGQITGDFTQAELDYLIRTLEAGSLPARLADDPISEQTIGPSLGADNLRAGLRSCIAGFIAVALFMVAYYYFSGIVATFALVMNLVLIVGVLAMFNATFTLPGIAALALTLGMAVDANVLIYERLREEQTRGLSLRMALRNAYDRAFSAIIDSNVTTIATSLILYWFGSEEIKGFGLTLAIGILCSMFTALFVTRTIFDLFIERLGKRRLSSLPMTFPRWGRILEPKIDWMGKAWFMLPITALITIVGLIAFFAKGQEMYDIEFVSGTQVQVQLKKEDQLGRTVTRAEVEEYLKPYEKALPALQVQRVGDTGTEFSIITANVETDQVRSAIMEGIGELLNVETESSFALAHADFDQALNQVVLPVTGQPLTVDNFTVADTRPFTGGVAIVLKNINPQLSANKIAERIERTRLEPGSNLPYRKLQVETPNRNPDQPAGTAVVLFADPVIDHQQDPAAWTNELARPMWKLVNDAIGRPADLRGVNSFNPQVASSMKTDATIAILLSIILIAMYIWVRFGNFKYGTATVVALAHDVLITVGAIGLTHYISEMQWARDWLLIEPFRVNLTLVAAVLTVMGYSVNDTIIVFDRIRENRGKFGHISRQVINDSINQTLSRTLLTGGTTLVTILVMYIWGGPSIHGFTFAMLIGILVGTYSSIVIASPLLLLGGKDVMVEGSKPAASLQRTSQQ